MIKVVAFDLFGTIFDMKNVPRSELLAYGNQLRYFHETGEWKPLVLPDSWAYLPAFSDVLTGLPNLRAHYTVVTLSNAPIWLTAAASKYNNISWDAIIPMRISRVYKPNAKAYLSVCELLRVRPEEVCMVSANKDFGDIEASRELGMQARLIRHESSPLKTLHDLCDDLRQDEFGA